MSFHIQFNNNWLKNLGWWKNQPFSPIYTNEAVLVRNLKNLEKPDRSEWRNNLLLILSSVQPDYDLDDICQIEIQRLKFVGDNLVVEMTIDMINSATLCRSFMLSRSLNLASVYEQKIDHIQLPDYDSKLDMKEVAKKADIEWNPTSVSQSSFWFDAIQSKAHYRERLGESSNDDDLGTKSSNLLSSGAHN
jgi:hypothetical protein